MDAVRILPVFGLLLFTVPLLWPTAPDETTGAGSIAMSVALSYIFLAWLMLIALALVLGRATRGMGADVTQSDDRPEVRSEDSG